MTVPPLLAWKRYIYSIYYETHEPFNHNSTRQGTIRTLEFEGFVIIGGEGKFSDGLLDLSLCHGLRKG